MTKSLLTLILSLSLVSGSANSAVPNNSEFKIGISQEFENLNPLIMTMLATTYMHYLVNRALNTLDTDGKTWYPQLAKAVPSMENGLAKFVGKDKKKIEAIWEIKDEAKWGDGKPLTCADFQLSHKIASSPMVSVGEKEVYTRVEKITFDPKTPKKCVFLYEKAKWDFYQMPQFYPLPSHLEAAVFTKYGKQKEGYERNSLYVKQPTNPGLYLGPYIISEVKLGSHITFVPNPHFYGEKPKIQKLIVKLIPNTGTLEANLRSHTIDAISSVGVTFDQALAFDKKIKAEKLPYEVRFQPSITYEHIALNLDNPILKDIKVRKALIYSINRQDLTKALFEGKQVPAEHNVSPKDPWYTNDPKQIVIYNYNKREANRLLDEAGWKMGPDGIRVKGKDRLALSFMTTAGNKTRELVQVYLKDQWKQVGIEVTIRNEPARVFFGETTRKRAFPAMAMFAWISSPESNPRSTLNSASIPTAKNGWSGQNVYGWKNAKVDELIEKIDLEFDAEKRTAMSRELQKYYTDEVPAIPLYYRADVAVTPTNLANFKLPGHQFSETNKVENWELK